MFNITANMSRGGGCARSWMYPREYTAEVLKEHSDYQSVKDDNPSYTDKDIFNKLKESGKIAGTFRATEPASENNAGPKI